MSFKQSDITQMTQEEKQLLLKDLCGRLPYGVNIQIYYEEIAGSETVWEVDNAEPFHVNDWGIEHIKPYLRPMSSMTSKEWVEFCDCSLKDEMSWVWTGNRQKFIPVQNREDYLNSKHFDYRGLIPMGLALEAPKDMYNI